MIRGVSLYKSAANFVLRLSTKESGYSVRIKTMTLRNFLLFLILVFLFYPKVSNASSYSKSTSETNIDGDGEVYTYLEAEVNGEKEVLETTEKGKHELILEKENSSTGVGVENADGEEGVQKDEDKDTYESTTEDKKGQEQTRVSGVLDRFFKLLKDFLNKLLTR